MANKITVSTSESNNSVSVSSANKVANVGVNTDSNSISINSQNNNAKYYSDKALESANKAEQQATLAKGYADSVVEAKNELLNNEGFVAVSQNLEPINTVAESIENVNYVGENIESINQLVEDLNNLGDTTNIEIVATNINSVNTTAENIEAVKTLSGSTNNMATIVNNLTSINYVADNIEDVATVEENKNIVLAQTIIATQQATIATEQANKANIFSQEAKAFRDEAEEIVTNAGSNASWGNISGTLSNQSDLQAVLDSKANVTDIPDLTNYVKNTDYATSSKHGIIKVDLATGISTDSTGKAYISKATDSLVTAKTNNYRPLVPSNIDLVVKTGITTNTIELTDEEKESAKEWLGISGVREVGEFVKGFWSAGYVPKNLLYCDGTEFSGAEGQMFRNLYVDYLTSSVQAITADFTITSNEGFETVLRFKASDDLSRQELVHSNDYTILYVKDGKLKGYSVVDETINNYGTITANSTFYVKVKIENGKVVIYPNSENGYTVANNDGLLDIRTFGRNVKILSSSTINGNALYSNGTFNPLVNMTYLATVVETDEKIRVGARLDTCSYAEYETELTMTGSCWKWAVDIANEKFKIPFIPDKVLVDVADTIGVRGNGIALGLTNGTLSGMLIRLQDSTNYNAHQQLAVDTSGELGKPIGGSATSGRLSGTTLWGIVKDTSVSGIEGVTTDAKTYKTIRHYVVVATGSINQNEADWSEFASSLASKANIDGSNFNESVKNFDGQWVASELELSSATAIGTYEIDLSNYLPNDEYNYEVLIKGYGVRTSANAAEGFVYSSIIPKSSISDFRCGANSVNTTNTFIVPIGSDRKIIILIKTNPFGTFEVSTVGYRRIGTNQ